MAIEKATGIVIRLQDYSETSQIATFVTDCFGRVSAIAKGAKRAKSSTGGSLDMLTMNEIVFTPSPSGGLATLREARTVEQFPSLRTSTARYYAGLYVAELAFTFTEGSEATDDYFELVLSTLRALGAHGAAVENILAFYQGRLLAVSGLAPNLQTCARCGSRPDSAAAVRISLEDGGILCRRCAGGVPVTRGCLAAVKRVFESTVTSVQRLRLQKSIQRDLAGILGAFIVRNARRVPRLARYVTPDLDYQLRKWLPPAQAAN